MTLISKYFKNKKSIPIDQFFEDVLYNDKHGYYSKKFPFGEKGDFITAPSISPLFGEMLSIWIVAYWESLSKPKNFNIVELGPGSGVLSKILIQTFKAFPEFDKTYGIYLYEKSKYLQKVQKKNINSKKIKWINNFDKIEKGPLLFFGNEFFDAIPIKQLVRKKGNLYEYHVYLDKDKNVKKKLIKASYHDINALKKINIFNHLKFIEYPKLGLNLIDKMIYKVKEQGGGILLIDYGYVKQTGIDTLQSVKSHKKNNIFSNLGEADVTSLVNFEILKNFFIKKKIYVENIVSQSFFLKRTGILERAEILSSKMSFKEKADLFNRLERLLNYKYMGSLFKVIFAHKNKSKSVLGFQ